MSYLLGGVSKPKYHTRWLWCWCCSWKSYEWISWVKLWQDRGRCFYCRMDYLDTKYGPSLQAELCKTKQGNYRPVKHLTRRELRRLLKTLNFAPTQPE